MKCIETANYSSFIYDVKKQETVFWYYCVVATKILVIYNIYIFAYAETGSDQLRNNRTADQRLCFRLRDSRNSSTSYS